MRKQAKYTYQKINQDTSKSKHSNTFYWDAKNIRVMSNKEFGAVTNQQGNELIKTLPVIESNPSTKVLSNVAFPIDNLRIIHSEKIDERVVLFSTNNSVDCIWLLEETSNDNFEITLLYIDELDFTEDTHLESVGINENNEAQKVYWVDGVNEVRFINIVDNNLINKEPSEISVTPRATLLDPSVTGYSSGGSHKAGVIQYAYNLYNKYGAQTKISGLSELVALQNDDKGNPLDAPINKSPNVNISNILQNFEYIKVYSIYYSSLNQTPRISLIYENDNTSESLELTDTNDIIQEVSLNEFNIIGTQSIIPKHITNKDGHLFFGDYKTKKFDFDYDARAFSFKRTALNPGVDNTANYTATIKHDNSDFNDYNIFNTTGNTVRPAGTISIQEFLDTVEDVHDCINEDNEAIYYPTNINSTTASVVGALGKNVKVRVSYVNKTLSTLADTTLSTSLKRGEKYRIGLVGYNNKDEESFVKWITDVKVPEAGVEEYESLVDGDNARLAKLTVEVNNLPDEVKSYRLVKVKRLSKDKTIKAQGFLSNNILNFQLDLNDENAAKVEQFFSNYSTRTIGGNNLDEPSLYQPTDTGNPDTLRGNKFNNILNFNSTVNINREISISSNVAVTNFYDLSDRDFSLQSAEIKENEININKDNDFIRVIGLAESTETFSKVDFYTAYEFTQVYGNADKDSDIFEVSINEEVLPRKTFTNSNSEDELFTFQVDPFNSDLGSFNLRDAFFNLEDNEDDNNSFKLITPKRSKFTFTKEDSSTVEVNDWEFKKIINNRKFNKSIKINDNKVGNFKSDGYILKTNDIGEDILISDFSFLEQATLDPQIVNKPTIFKNYVDITNFKSNFYTISNTQIIFNSDDLYDVIDSLEANSNKSSLVIGEIVSDSIVQYGGNTYVDRQRNQYIPLSKKILSNRTFTGQIDGQYGDTYIQKQSYLTTNYVNSPSANLEGTLAEVITYIGESSINHDMRYDNIEDKNTTNNIDFQDVFLYNEVYQQENDLIKSISKPFNFSIQEEFRSEVVASPKKILGEFIDNWTTISINDRITLDTKYGEITAFAKLNDVLYTFQRNGLAYLAVNPRVQLQANDNIPIQLGTGRLIERYQYISTESGTLHPRSVEETEGGIFYFDTLNYSINRLAGQKEEISLTKGLYNFIKDFSIDNYDNLFPINKVVTHYDNLNEEIYFTFNVENGFTVAYNLLSDGFVSFYDFTPNIYFTINNNMFSVPSDNTIWEHSKGEYNNFYGQYYPSSITLLFNEDSDYEKILDNLMYITNVKEQGEDKVNVTFNKIKVNNAYQTTGNKDLIIGQNIKRKFREFNLTIPREEGTRNRIRGEYALIKLEFDYPANNYELTLNDSIISYTIN